MITGIDDHARNGAMPPRYFVAEWMTMSAPHSMGLVRKGRDSVVDDQRNASRCAVACAIFSISKISPLGLGMVSP